MKSQTLKALRALARERGLKGYSKLSKEELLRRLQAGEERASIEAAPASEEAAAPAPPTEAPPDTVSYPEGGAIWWEPARTVGPASTRFSSEEEQVEGTKYALAPGGEPGAGAVTDLGEEIDRLPALREPVLGLLPQKPGILHAYWVLPEGMRPGRELRLRLARGERERLEVWQELPLPSASGNWYFHVPETLYAHDVVLELGDYRDGAFVRAMVGSVARLPSLYASGTTDRDWPIAEEDFRRLYLRAGGFEAGARRYGWAASIGSPGAAAPPGPGPGEERLAWPGGVSSR